MGKRCPVVVYVGVDNLESMLVTAAAIEECGYNAHTYPDVVGPGGDTTDLYVCVPAHWSEGQHFADWYRDAVENDMSFDEDEDEDGRLYEVVNFGEYLVHVLIPV